MDSRRWQNVFDKLDEDIINSAAERLNNSAVDDEYPPDCNPKEIHFSGKKRGHGGLFAGIGVAAAAAVTGVVIVGNNTLTPAPMSSGADLKSTSAVSASSIVIEDSAALEDSLFVGYDTLSVPEGFAIEQMDAFEQYFCGDWLNEESAYSLCYCEECAFSEDYPCVGIEEVVGGCYMWAEPGEQYDLWYAATDSDELYVYRNVTLEDGRVQYSDTGDILCESTEVLYRMDGSHNDYPTLGYFGKYMLCSKLNMSYEMLYGKVQLETYSQSDSGEDTWARADIYNTPWDKVVLDYLSDTECEMTMAFTSASVSKIAYFRLNWALSDESGEWELTNVDRSKDVFAVTTADDTLDTADFKIYEDTFCGVWADDSSEITLSYSEDVFDPNNTCVGFFSDDDGLYMYKRLQEEDLITEIYFVPADDPGTMYLYMPDKFGYAAEEDYVAKYTKTAEVSYDIDLTQLSWMGLQKWIAETESEYGGSFGEAIDEMFAAVGNVDTMLVSYFNYTMHAFEGYSVEELDSGSYAVTFRIFSKDTDESRQVTMRVKLTDGEWQVMPKDGDGAVDS